MSTVTSAVLDAKLIPVVSDGLWMLAWKRLRRDKIAMIALVIVVAFMALAIASALRLAGADWSIEKGVGYARPSFAPNAAAGVGGGSSTSLSSPQGPAPVAAANALDPLAGVLNDIKAGASPTGPAPTGGVSNSAASNAAPSASIDPLADVLSDIKGAAPSSTTNNTQVTGVRQQTLLFGGDKWGRDVFSKAIKGAETSLFVGFAAALVATVLGTLLGAFAGYYGGWVDDLLNWFYSIFNAIPYILLVLSIAAVLQSKGVMTVVLILGLTGWTSVFRLVRAEYLKHKQRDYVRAADAIGASDQQRMFVHILPNISHVILVNLSLLVVGFIKSEVILSFLGFGVPVDTVSWGSMLNEAQNEMILGYWWQLAAATLFMSVLVTAFSLFTDALRDALDPKIQ